MSDFTFIMCVGFAVWSFLGFISKLVIYCARTYALAHIKSENTVVVRLNVDGYLFVLTVTTIGIVARFIYAP